MSEGVSFLVLLGIAMPLKYLADMPMVVKVVGWIHGALFITFCWALLWARREGNWPLSKTLKVFVAALVRPGDGDPESYSE